MSLDDLLRHFPVEQPRKRIVRNSARCAHCGDEIESRSVHDFRQCRCGAIFVDGGRDYLRRGGNPVDFIDTSLEEEVKDEPNPG